MPKNTNIASILIIGAGPIVIGQACEFDYSGTQACKALKNEGYRVVLVNSNPATIMTDPGIADSTYIEPINPNVVAKVIERERPDALLPTMGGQTALNVARSLSQDGILKKFGIQLIGADLAAIEKAENRQQFCEAMTGIGLETPRSSLIKDFAEAAAAIEHVGLPVIIRPSYTLGGQGGGIAYNLEEFEQIVRNGIRLSPINEVLIEESVLGWKEFEMEVVRDKADNCMIICSIENVDPMGVHTGDSITVAPALTLSDKEYQRMRNASIAVLRCIGVDTGGSNVQFAVDPVTGRQVVIEMNPRVSRSSALASKATGFPIAKIAAKLAVGYTLDELSNDIIGNIPASFEPTVDYVVTKIPRFTFEKFPGSDSNLTTSMKSVGEVVAIGRTFQESLQKALRSLDTGLSGLEPIELKGVSGEKVDSQAITSELSRATADRLLNVAQALRVGVSVDEVHRACCIDPWFLDRIAEIIAAERAIESEGLPSDAAGWQKIKSMGFSDARIGQISGHEEDVISARRRSFGVHPVFKRIDTCSAEISSYTPYLYSTYEINTGFDASNNEANPSCSKKIIILGGGPNRIGQGIEFDYCCVHAAYALSEAGFETIMVNCNPETVSTDYDTSDRLYFEPLTAEDVIELVNVEQSNGKVIGCVVQFGGQTPLKLAAALEKAQIPILGTSPDAIDLAEDRDRFQKLLRRLDLRHPANGIATSTEQAEKIADQIGYRLVIRPSYVLGGRAMEIVHEAEGLRRYMTKAVLASGNNPVLIDSFLRNATEIDVDAVADGTDVFIAGVMEHIEEAGIHSGDSACSLPPVSLRESVIKEVKRQATILAKGLNVVGLMNVQLAVREEEVFILEVNPRASRTVPFVAKATGVPIAKIASRVMAGEKLSAFTLPTKDHKHVAVKEAVFPFSRFPDTDIILGPEMKSTGEVMGIDNSFDRAFAKSQLAAGIILPSTGTVFVSVKDSDKTAILQISTSLKDLGFTIIATTGTAYALKNAGIDSYCVRKVLEGRPHIVDKMLSGHVDLVINTTEGAQAIRDSFSLRHTALTYNIPYYTTVEGASAAVRAITAMREGNLEVNPIQNYLTRSF
ncbi:carbamoyl-phosphate synthase, large subunit [Candidatus Endolissoclinum faulkneri L2]|uniref:Carbamoyl phosphate synthase large chain n=1 Tax=Candidatus Endolissoclinum faulkneri L2 TaxID=1193729 RepID=K7YLX6_9PROT|nr:carbamoyl-phosphate synthase large subunit [Candidatus Endolissoclinum faulkneri]AFX98477.1 carbamoyl-phosphate synthase, large subunit [Candidatus Endolissoclinum faulkneri L2]